MSDADLPEAYAAWLGENAFERSARLAEDRRFSEAAPVALEAAGQYLSRGFRVPAFDAYGAAGKFFHLAGDDGNALQSFDRAFDLFEHDVVYLTRPTLVIARLASWPELYARAALAALNEDDPFRAIAFAETGRARAIANRVGPDRARRPPQAPPELWDEYLRTWRLAVARAANELVDATQASDFRAYDTELTALRRKLVEAGANPEDLSPVTPRFEPALAIAALKRTSRPTVVLYSIRLDKAIRFIRLAADGVHEVRLAANSQALVARAADDYIEALRGQPGPLDALVEKYLPPLLAKAGPALRTAIDETLNMADGGRLLWVPQGSLVAIPLLACPTKAGLVIDRAAVTVAPSLAFGLESLAPDLAARPHPSAVSGRAGPREPSTDGGVRLLARLAADIVSDTVPRSPAQLERAVRSANVVQVTCHGVYDWSDPLQSYLKLGAGFDISVGELFDASLFDPEALVLFGACDSGTVAQSDINEAIGIPIAAMAAGACAVVGAVWPVSHAVAVGICARFLGELALGAASPEALQAATVWMRDATVDDLIAELDGLGHPLAVKLRESVPALRRRLPLFASPHLWASYVHWGRGWRVECVQH
jgi:CHAT domain-containing protein